MNTTAYSVKHYKLRYIYLMIFMLISSMYMLFIPFLSYIERNILIIMLLFGALFGTVYSFGFALFLVLLIKYIPEYTGYNIWLSVAFWSIILIGESNIKIFSQYRRKIYFISLIIVTVSLTVAFLQAYVVPVSFWHSISRDFSIGHGRGAGFRTEPSYLFGVIFLYLSSASKLFDFQHMDIRRKILPIMIFITGIIVTKSISVSLLLPMIIFILFPNIMGIRSFVMAALVVLFFYHYMDQRINQALSYEEFDLIITKGFGSWRNVPDIFIVKNFSDYIFPTLDHRDVLTTISYGFYNNEWLRFTFSVFSTTALSFGMLIMTILIVVKLKRIFNWKRSMNNLNYLILDAYAFIILLFLIPKFDALSWFAYIYLVSYEKTRRNTIHHNDANRYAFGSFPGRKGQAPAFMPTPHDTR